MLNSFALCILTSAILYIAPHGRVAYWSDWRLWGLSKAQWSELHLNLGILLLLAGLLHMFYNWNPMIAYLKNKAKKLNIFTVNFNIALLLSLLVGLGTYFQVPPFVSIINLSSTIKDSAGIKYGEPPYGHAELSSLRMLTGRMNLDLSKSMGLLNQADIQFENETQNILEIAKTNNLTPKQIYEIIKPATSEQEDGLNSTFPDFPPPGFGNMTLNEVCEGFRLDIASITGFLSSKGIKVDPALSIKQIAAENRKEPMSLFEMISETAKKNKR